MTTSAASPRAAPRAFKRVRFALVAATEATVLHLPAYIGSVQINIVVDTGASTSWIDESLCAHLQLQVHSNSAVHATMGVGNNVVASTGTCTVQLCIGNMLMKAVFNVTSLPRPCDALLGCDWLAQHKGVIDVAERQVRLKCESGDELVWGRTEDKPVNYAATQSPCLQPHASNAPEPRACFAKLHTARRAPAQLSPADTASAPPRQPLPQLPSLLSRSTAMPASLSTALVEISAQQDIYGRNVVSLDDVEMGDTGPHAVSATELRHLLQQFHDICPDEIPPGIPDERWELGPFQVIPVKPEATPQRGARYRMSPRERDELDKQTEYLLQQGWIRKSTSAWACACIFAPKGFQGEDGLRVCQDYRRVNSVTVKNSTPIPRIDDLLDAAAGFTICSSLDLASGYHQIPLTAEESPRTAFYGTKDLFEFTVMPFGLTNAPAVFQTAMQRALEGYIGKFVLVYLDDVLVFSRSPSEHLQHLKLVLNRLRTYTLYLRLRKCRFNRRELPYLGHILSADGIRPDPRKVQVVKDWPSPLKTVKAVEQFLGLANYFRKFIRGYGAVTAPLAKLKRKNAAFHWDENCQQAFDYVKQALTSAPILTPPDTTAHAAPFEVICDASGEGIGAGLFQHDKVIAFEGRKYRPAEYNYSVGEQELLAVVHALHVWRCYLEGAPAFKVITDHNPLIYINSQQHLSRRQARWVEFMQRFQFEWVYRPGRTNVADPISRAPSLQEQPLAHLHDGTVLHALSLSAASERNDTHTATVAVPPPNSTTNQSRAAVGAQLVSLLFVSVPLSQRLPSLVGRNPSSTLALLESVQGRRRSARLQKNPQGAEASVCQRRAAEWEAAPTDAQPARGSEAGQAAQLGEALPTDSTNDAEPDSDANGLTANEPEDADATLADQVASDEELASIVADFLDTVRGKYRTDAFYKDPKNLVSLTERDGLFWHGHRLAIPADPALRRRCLEVTHDAPWAGHFGRDKTAALISSIYWWPGISQDVAEYIKSCPSCQRSKPHGKKPFGLMIPLQAPVRRWSSIGIDFITHLPITRSGFDAIAVFVDRLTKRVHLAPCHDTTTAQDFADIFVRVIFAQHGLPLDIVSDRDTRFTSEFWKRVCQILGVQQNMSTAFHPQTDGQTERVNRTLEEVLRSFVAGDHSDWDKCLPLAEFAINNSLQAATGTTPFLMDSGQAPLTPNMAVIAAQSPKDAAYPFIGKWRETVRRVKSKLAEAQVRYKQLFDKHATDKEYTVGQRVLLSTKNLKSLLGKSYQAERSFKLMPKHLGPFPILARIGKVAYRLDLSSAKILKDVHPVFHVSLLRDFHESKKFSRTGGKKEVIDGEVHQGVKRLVDYRTHYGYPQYLTEWSDGSPTEWMFEADLREDMPEALDDFIAQYQASVSTRKQARTERKNTARGKSKRRRLA